MKKTQFDQYLEEQLGDPAFAARFARAGDAWGVAEYPAPHGRKARRQVVAANTPAALSYRAASGTQGVNDAG